MTTDLFPAMTDTAFELPPIVHNARGEIRKAGFELEYAGLSLEAAALIVQHVFGGRHLVESPSVQRVEGTRVGTFKLEIDSSLLKDRKYEQPLRALGVNPETFFDGGSTRLERGLAKLFAVAGVPY